MNINGKPLTGLNTVTVFIPRGENDGIEFTCRSVVNMEIFNQLCPEPVPPKIVRPGKAPIPDLNNKKFLEEMEEHNKKRLSYMIVTSLSATEGLEWETVKEMDPDTWEGYAEELKTSGFTSFEINKIIEGVLKANSLDENYIKQAYDNFLALKAASLNTE